MPTQREIGISLNESPNLCLACIRRLLNRMIGAEFQFTVSEVASSMGAQTALTQKHKEKSMHPRSNLPIATLLMVSGPDLSSVTDLSYPLAQGKCFRVPFCNSANFPQANMNSRLAGQSKRALNIRIHLHPKSCRHTDSDERQK